MATMPAARPSSPSMRLMAWVIPSSHSTVTSGIQSSERHEDAEERQAEVVHRDAEPDEGQAGDHRAGDLGRRRHALDVVGQADGDDDRRPPARRPAARSCGRTAGRSGPAAGPRRWRRGTRGTSPARRSPGSAWCARCARWARRASPASRASAPTSGVSDERRHPGHAADEEVVTRRRHEPVSLRAGRPQRHPSLTADRPRDDRVSD